MGWRAASFGFGAATFAVWLGLNARIAWRNLDATRVPLSFFEVGERSLFNRLDDSIFFEAARHRLTWLLIGLLSWLAGLGCAARYLTFLRLANSEATGLSDKISNFDIGFFLFQLPFWNWLSRFCLTAIIAALLLVVAIYFYEELFGPSLRIKRIKGPMAKHIALLWGALLLWKGLDCVLVIPNSFVGSGNVAARVFDQSDMRFGWTSAAVFALLTPAVALFSGIAIARSVRFQTFLYGLGWIVCANIFPFLLPLVVGKDIQDVQWQSALKRHIENTRTTWGLGEVQREQIGLSNSDFTPVTRGRPSNDSPVPVALWSPPSAVAAINEKLIADKTGKSLQQVWVSKNSKRLAYTGIGTSPPPPEAGDWRARHQLDTEARIVQMEASAATSDGKAFFRPDQDTVLVVRPEVADRAPSSPTPGQNKVDQLEAAPDAGDDGWKLADATNGTVGVQPSSFGHRITLALRFFESGFLSQQLGEKDVVLWKRGAAQRCSALAPFLNWELTGPPVLLPGPSKTTNTAWLVAGVVWTDDYPNSAVPAVPGTAPRGLNYGRQVALGVVDGATGKTSLFALDETEPFLALYRRAFPGIIRPSTSIPAAIREQVRPAPGLLAAQCLIWGRYHEEDEAWVKRNNTLRPLITPVGSEDDLLRPYLDPQGVEWQLMAYSLAGGTVNAPGSASSSASALTALLGVDASNLVDRHGQAKFVEWRTEEPLPMPDFVASPTWSAPPFGPWISITPRFDGGRKATGLLATRGEVANARQIQSQNGQDRTTGLFAELALFGSGVDVHLTGNAQPGASSSRLKAARDAWNGVLTARRSGDWSAVSKAEAQLSRALTPSR